MMNELQKNGDFQRHNREPGGMLKDDNEIVGTGILRMPKWQMEDLCRTLLEAVQEFYESEENVEKFKEWERRRKDEDNER